jgi:hypothetical protein
MITDSVSHNADRAGLRALFEDASAGLNPGEREVIELQLCQGLEAGEVATVLGVSPSHARVLLSRADSQLEACLTVLLVGRAGRDDCDELGALLADWNGQLTAALRTRAHRHIGRCATCTARRAAELRPARLLAPSPRAALAAGAAASSRAALAAPSGLKAHTIALATGHGPAAAAHSAAVLARAGAFGKQGFPKQARARRRHADRQGAFRPRPFPPGQAPTTTTVMVAVTAAAVAFALTGTSQHVLPSAYPKRHVTVAGTPTAAAGDAARGRGPAPSAVRGLPVVPPRPAVTVPGPTRTGSARASEPASTEPASTEPASTGPASTGAPVSGAPGAATGRRTGTRPDTESSAVKSPTPAAWVPAQRGGRREPAGSTGTLSAALSAAVADGGTLIAVPGSLVALRATGGTVRWSAAVAGDCGHAVSVSPGSGTLTPGDPVTTLTIKASRTMACRTDGSPRCHTVTLSPGGTRFTVWPAGMLPDLPDGPCPIDGRAGQQPVASLGSSAGGTRLTRGRTKHA